MKKVIFSIFILTISLTSFAQTLITCTTAGDALSSVEVVKGEPGKIIVHDLDDSTKAYTLNAGTKDLEESKGDTLIAAKDLDNVFGGAIMDAVMMRVAKGAKKATLAMNGSVYFLDCVKP